MDIIVLHPNSQPNHPLKIQPRHLDLMREHADNVWYFKTEQADSTPFTENGANLLRKLGIRCIWMPIVAVVIASVITVCLGAERSGDISNFPSLVTGIVLILSSLIFRYGAELEQRNRADIAEANQ